MAKILSWLLKLVTTWGKSSISAVWRSFEISFALVIFAKLFPIYLLNFINIFHHTSVLCTVKYTWPYVQEICLITKIINKVCVSIVYDNKYPFTVLVREQCLRLISPLDFLRVLCFIFTLCLDCGRDYQSGYQKRKYFPFLHQLFCLFQWNLVVYCFLRELLVS